MLRSVPMISSIFPAITLISGSDTKKPLGILGVGNSFTVNATNHLEGLVKESGNEVKYTGAIIGGSSFRRHLDAANAFERDPSSDNGRPYKTMTGNVSLQELLKKEQWDIVTIQQVSSESHKVDSFRPDAKELHDYIKKYSPNAEVVLHRTWVYRDDKPLGTTSEKMQEGIVNAYEAISQELKCRVIPSGDAFWEARKDPKLMKHLYSDFKHAGLYGDYMAGCVWLEVLFGANCIDNKYLAGGRIDPETARRLQEIAHRAAENIREKNRRFLKQEAQVTGK